MVLPDGGHRVVPHTGTMVGACGPTAAGAAPFPAPAPVSAAEPAPAAGTVRLPLGRLVGARSGDKGGNANVGLWARDPAAFGWLRAELTVERFRALLPEAAALEVRRYELPNLGALNFVVVGLLGQGVAASARPDPQAKGLGEYLRSRLVDVPASLLGSGGRPEPPAVGAAGGDDARVLTALVADQVAFAVNERYLVQLYQRELHTLPEPDRRRRGPGSTRPSAPSSPSPLTTAACRVSSR